MVPIIPIIAILAALAAIYIVIFRRKRTKTPENAARLSEREKAAKVREASKRLSQNPRDPEALTTIAEAHYTEKDFEKAYKEYEILVELSAVTPSLDGYEMTVRLALSALSSGHSDRAYESFIIAKAMKNVGFEVNFNLGRLEYERKNFQKAIACLTLARVAEPEHVETLRYLGRGLFQIQRFAEASALLRKVLDASPDDKESMFALARCYHETGNDAQALNIFTRLRTDPQLGPKAAIYAGTIHHGARAYKEAEADFQIGLHHVDIPPALRLEMSYRLAVTYINQEDIAGAVGLLQEVTRIDPEYKDAAKLLDRYRELNSNENLKIFLISQTSEFITLCRKIAVGFFPNAKVKVTEVSVRHAEYADILTEVTTPKAQSTMIFRFVRTTGAVGELILRDLYTRIKEIKAARGFCLVAGTFTDGARQFVDARLIDLVDKEALMHRLRGIRRSERDTPPVPPVR